MVAVLLGVVLLVFVIERCVYCSFDLCILLVLFYACVFWLMVFFMCCLGVVCWFMFCFVWMFSCSCLFVCFCLLTVFVCFF